MTVCQPRATSDTLVAADWDWVCSSCRSSTPICADDSNKKRRGRVGGSGSGRGGRANQMYVENGEYIYFMHSTSSSSTSDNNYHRKRIAIQNMRVCILTEASKHHVWKGGPSEPNVCRKW